jgi:hypothetical protein
VLVAIVLGAVLVAYVVEPPYTDAGVERGRCVGEFLYCTTPTGRYYGEA